MKKGQSGPLPISTGSSVGGNTMSKKESLTKYPWYAWLLLATGLLAVSTAGATFRTIEGVGPLLKASWRLQATTLVLIPGFLYQWFNADEQTKLHWKSKESRSALTLSGAFLCLHFAAWVWSLDHTSLTHFAYKNYSTRWCGYR